MRRMTFKLPSHIFTAIAATIIGGGVMTAGASAPDILPTDPVPAEQPAQINYGPDFTATACGSAPAQNKYELYQSPNYVGQTYTGSNDRMLAAYSNTMTLNTSQPTYSSNLEITVTGRMKVSEAWICMATVTTIYKGIDDAGMYPIYEYVISDVAWEKAPVIRDRFNRSLYAVNYPQGTYTYDEVTGNSTSRYPVNFYITGQGAGKTVPSTVTPYVLPSQK